MQHKKSFIPMHLLVTVLLDQMEFSLVIQIIDRSLGLWRMFKYSHVLTSI